MANQFSYTEIASAVAQSAEDGIAAAYELYHLRSSLDQQHLFEISSTIQRALSQEYVVDSFGKVINAQDFPAITLESSQTPDLQQIRKIWAKRVSTREYSSLGMQMNELSILLEVLTGESPTTRHRSYPSAGGCFPNEVFINVRNVKGLAPGFYYADLGTNSLCLVNGKNLLFTLDKHEAASDLTIVIISLFNRTTYKYGERGYRFALLEAGAMTQIIETTVGHLGLGAVSSGGYRDDLILNAAELSNPQAGVLAVIHVGSKK